MVILTPHRSGGAAAAGDFPPSVPVRPIPHNPYHRWLARPASAARTQAKTDDISVQSRPGQPSIGVTALDTVRLHSAGAFQGYAPSGHCPGLVGKAPPE